MLEKHSDSILSRRRDILKQARNNSPVSSATRRNSSPRKSTFGGGMSPIMRSRPSEERLNSAQNRRTKDSHSGAKDFSAQTKKAE